jgi:hypothetical protein
MKRNLLYVITVSAVLAGAHFVGAQEMHPHMHEHSNMLGQVNFRISCNHEAQMQFNHAVAWLHSFEYEEAQKAFTEVTVTDPRCGMGYWGVAMSSYHPLWTPPSDAELRTGSRAVEQGQAVGARTQRERDYLAAIEVFYKDADKLDHRRRAFAYSETICRGFGTSSFMRWTI